MATTESSQTMLSPAVIDQHMEEVIQAANPQLAKDFNGWRLRRVVFEKDSSSNQDDDVVLWSQCNGDLSLGNPAHYYGMLLFKTSDKTEPTAAEESKSMDPSCNMLLSFYLAYSSWDGRCLHVDKFHRDSPECPVKPVALLQILAQVAIRLGCRRLVWMQTGDPDWSFVTLPDSTAEPIKPETLNGWLMSKMDRSAMESYAGKSGSEDSEAKNEPIAALDRPTIETKIQQVCAELQSASSSSLRWRLVLEDGLEKDATSMFNMVQELAIYEKEPDAVQSRAKDYQRDGSGPHPLLYCLLLEDTSEATPTACGMTFIYFGYSMMDGGKGGRFLYLEDLYLDPSVRRKGAGTVALKALAKIGLSLDCQYLLWTVLDWNQPALNLYAKMGAVVQDGLKISRYKDDNLIRFANAS